MSDELTLEGTIAKVDADERQVFGWASVTEINGEPVVDLQGDYMETYELEKAAYDYVLSSRVGGEMHQRVKKDSPKQVGTLIESMVLTPEKIEKMGLPDSTPHGWWIGFQIGRDEAHDPVWDAVKKGKYTGFSIHGLGKRKGIDKVEKGVMTRSAAEYKKWLERMSDVSGISAKQIDEDLKDWMVEAGLENPTDDDIHDFLLEAYGSGYDEDEVTKHLIGRHEQKDHGSRHSRKDHQTGKGAATMAGLGAAAGSGTSALANGPGKTNPKRLGIGAGIGGGVGAVLGALSGASSGGDNAEWNAMSPKEKEAQMVESLGSDIKSVDEYARAAGLSRAEALGVEPIPTNKDELWQDAIDRNVRKSMDKHELYRELLVKAAEKSDNVDEFTENVVTIGKMLIGKDNEGALYFDSVHKHLIGRHKQKDHGKGKGKYGHSRDDHEKVKDRGGKEGSPKLSSALGAAGFGALGAFQGAKLGGIGAVSSGISGALGGAMTGYQAGGGQLFGNKKGTKYGAAAAGLGNTVFDPVGTGVRRVFYGDPNKTFKKRLSKREHELLEKYLGPIDTGDDQ